METEQQTQKWQWFVAATLLIVWVAGIITVYLYPVADRKTFMAHSMYYVLSALFISWMSLVLQDAGRSFQNRAEIWAKYKVPILVALALTLCIVLSGRFGLKVLSDETNLIAVSKSFFHEKTMYNMTMGDWYYENFHPTNREFPKRPAMFPYILSLLHVLLGYSLQNAYILNIIVLFALLVFMGVLFRRHMGNEWATIGLFFILAQPVLVTCATSAGFDLISTLFFCLTLGAAYRHMQTPTSETLLRFWFTGIIWAFVRYETGLFVGIIAGFMWIRGYVKWEHIKRYPIAYAMGPIFVSYRVGQVLLTAHNMENKGEALLSPTYIVRNVGAFFEQHLKMNSDFPHNLVLNWLGMAALAIAIYLFIRRQIASQDTSLRDAALVTVIVTCGLQLLFFCHHVGRYAHPAQNRFFLIYCFMAAVGTVWLLHRYVKLPRFLMLSLAFILLCGHLHTAQDDRFNLRLTQTRKTYYTHRYLQEHASQNILIVVDRPGQYTVLDRAAMNFKRANKRRSTLLRNLKRNLYEDIWIIQDIEHKTGKPKKSNVLEGEWNLETMTEIQFTPTLFARISRVLPVPTNAHSKKEKFPPKPPTKIEGLNPRKLSSDPLRQIGTPTIENSSGSD